MPVKKYKDTLHKATNLGFPFFLLLYFNSNFSAVFFFLFVN